jgi:hypothetical protein
MAEKPMRQVRVAVDEDWPSPQAATPVRTSTTAQARRIDLMLIFAPMPYSKRKDKNACIDAIMRAPSQGYFFTDGGVP